MVKTLATCDFSIKYNLVPSCLLITAGCKCASYLPRDVTHSYSILTIFLKDLIKLFHLQVHAWGKAKIDLKIKNIKVKQTPTVGS